MPREVSSSTTLVIDDASSIIEVNNTSESVTAYVYIPLDATVNFSDFTEIKILRTGPGAVIIAPVEGSSGISINGESDPEAAQFYIPNRYGLATLIKVSDNDNWTISGDVVRVDGGDTNLEFPRPRMPKLSDPANIEKTFNLYHFGLENGVTENTTFEDLGDGSVARSIGELQARVNAANLGQISVTAIGNTTNLNDVKEPGFYATKQTINNTDDISSRNYPTASTGVAAGPGNMIVVKNSSNGVTQIYQVFNTQTKSNTLYIRSSQYNNSTVVDSPPSNPWSAWSEIAKGNLDNYLANTSRINNLVDVTITTTSATAGVALADGHVLTWNNTTKKWSNKGLSSLSGKSFIGRVVYTSNNTWTKANYPANPTLLRIYGVGGGGGGGGARGTTSAINEDTAVLGGGGGGGGYFDLILPGSIPATLAITVGAAGAAGLGATPTAGGNGGETSVKDGATTIASASGGTGGTQRFADGTNYLDEVGSANGGPGGSASVISTYGGNSISINAITVPGGIGSRGFLTEMGNYKAAHNGIGGGSFLSSSRGFSVTAAGTAGSAPGEGGSGARVTGNTSNNGGAGAAGIVVIEMYA